jgi:quinolinate synthase
MADMANLAKVERCWRELAEVLNADEETVTPVTYINSAADLKAFCGAPWRHRVYLVQRRQSIAGWALGRREKILFFPDQHLGRWTGYKMGIALDEMMVWDPDLEMGGLTPNRSAREAAAVERTLFGTPDVPAGAHPAFSQSAPGRPGHRAPRMQLRSLPPVGFRRLDRAHRAHHQGSAGRTRAGWSAPN